jgi:DNA polymerase-4
VSRAPRSSSARRFWGDDEDGCGILHVDMDAFFASVEIARRPELAGRPVIVGGSARSVVLSATYEARAAGVHSAMPMARARVLCPQAVVVPPDQAAYRRVSHGVMEIFRDVTPLVEPVSVDEAYLDVSGARRTLGMPTEIARTVRERVHQGFGITCSVGLASTKLVAKLASTHAKPDGLMLVPAAATNEFLRELPVGALPGVGERTQVALVGHGIGTVAELADSDPTTLRSVLGVSAAARLHDLAWGRDPRDVETTRVEKSIGTESTFPQDVRDTERLLTELLALADRCAARLRAQSVMARVVSVKVRTSDFRTVTRARTLPSPADTAAQMSGALRELFADVDLRGMPVRLLGVRAENLEPRDVAAIQLTLEESTAHDDAPGRAVEGALDAVRARFGANSLRRGSLVSPSTTTARAGELS